MYRIKDAESGSVIEDNFTPCFVKQQERVDLPIVCGGLEEADGVVLSDDVTMLGIKGKRMDNYLPLVTIEEVNGEPYLMERMNDLEKQLKKAQQERQEMRDDNIALMMGVADLYTAVTTPQEGV